MRKVSIAGSASLIALVLILSSGGLAIAQTGMSEGRAADPVKVTPPKPAIETDEEVEDADGEDAEGTGGEAATGAVEAAKTSPPATAKPAAPSSPAVAQAAVPNRNQFQSLPIPTYVPAPAIWKFGDADTEIHLFGTVHALPYQVRWRNAKLNKIMAKADEAVFESRTGNALMSEETRNTVMRKVFHYNRTPFLERVEEKYRAALKDELKLRRIPLYMADGMPSWHTAFGMIPRDLFSPNSYGRLGVENVLEPEFKRRGITITALEDGDEVFLKFSTLDEKAQHAMLNRTIARIVAFNKLRETKKPTAAEFWDSQVKWATGQAGDDNDAEYRTVFGPEFYKAILVDRNAVWADWLTKRLARPGKVFVAVGYAHLVGPDSVQNMLAKRGIKTKREQ
jgi:uncharacterized protein